MGNLFTELMRRLFALLDGIVAWAIELLYVLLIKIADTNVFGELIYQYLGRIYTFLGIFMVFKLSFAMINYIINPDTLTDKGKGFSKLITNVVISLILLAITPNLFDAAFKLQSDLLSSNAVYQIVTGKKLPTSDGNSNKSLEENAKVQGKEMSYAVYSSFIYKSGGDDYELEDQKICEIKAGATCLLDEDVIIKKDGKKFTYEYKYLISTICGCAVAYMLLMFCFDAAVRSVKLGFLQIIAPIPILSMIDPGKGTDKVSKWGKECGKTFIDLFIRLAGIFFALDVIHSILSSKEMMEYYSSGASVNNLFVRLFVIIGCLMFAKQLPNLIESILGIKLSGDGFSLKKKLGNVPGLGVAKAAGAGALGFAGGMAANAWATKGNWKGQGFKGGLRNVGSMLAGGMSGAGRGLTSKEKNLFKAAGAGVKGSVDARNLREQRNLTGYNFGKRTMANLNAFAGVDSLSHYDTQISQFGDVESKASNILKRANSEMIKYNYSFKGSDGNYTNMNDFKAKKEYLNLLRGQDTSKMNDAQREAHAKLISDTQTYISKTEKLAEQAFVDNVIGGTISDEQITSMIAGLSNTIQTASDELVKAQDVSTGAAIKATKDAMGTAKVNVQNDKNYQQAQANKKQK
jgi:hypothetical protein